MEAHETNLSSLAPHPLPYPAVVKARREFERPRGPSLGIAATFKATCRLYCRQWWTLVVATAAVVLPAAGLSCVLKLTLATPDLQLGVKVASTVLGATASLLAGLVVVRIAWQGLLGRPTSVRAAYRDVLSSFWALSWLATLYSVAVTLAALTVVGIPLALYVGSGWALVLQVGLLEGRSGRAALGRSTALVRGHRQPVLAAILLITASGSILANAPAGIARLISTAATSGPGPAMWAEESVEVASIVLLALGESLAEPLAWIAGTILYYELQTRECCMGLEQAPGVTRQETRPQVEGKPLPYGSLGIRRAG